MKSLLYQTVSARTSRLLPEPVAEQIRHLRIPDPVRLMTLALAAGVAAGTLLSVYVPEQMPALMQGLAVTDEPRTLWDAYSGAVLPVLAMIGALILAGESAHGRAAALLILLLRGIGIGAAGAACMRGYALDDALLLTAALILPYALVTVALLIWLGKEAGALSGRLRTYLHGGDPEPEIAAQRRDLLLHAGICLLVTLLAAGAHGLLLTLLNARVLQSS